MKKIFLGMFVVASCVSLVFGQKDAVKAFAAFDNVKTTGNGEHGSGYKVRLWKNGGSFVGLIYVQDGLMGDPPVGVLENLKYNSSSKELSFTAKYTAGTFFDKTHDGAASHDLLRFEGTLTPSRLIGIIKSTNELCADKCRTKVSVSLHRWKDGLEFMKNFKTLDEWKADNKEELDSLGPKW